MSGVKVGFYHSSHYPAISVKITDTDFVLFSDKMNKLIHFVNELKVPCRT